MKENNSVGTLEKVRTDFIGELLVLEELETKIAPSGGHTTTIIVGS